MKLKSLEISGFKSFVDKTVVSFDKDVTAIVGPNGCGKSNIVDAIRWVMGEQSAKHLRGRNMEDVIFSGSENRAPLSMASVELTFSTAGYQTPPAYANHSEISIGRRLYRTGEGSLNQSEYFINKAPVRLKDITDLFLGTGVGTKAYSIIEQGRIGQVVHARPEERRFYIEEAAGISKFKARKEAALRKIESTQQNLLRLSDIVTELERQVSSLDRQAKKAEKYKTTRQEFQKWDFALSSHHYARLNSEQEQLERELKTTSRGEEENQLNLRQAENCLEVAKTDLVSADEVINRTQNDLFELNNTLQLGEAALRYKKEEEENLNKRLKEVEQMIVEYKTEEKGIQNGLEQVNEQKCLSDLDVNRLEESAAEVQKKVDEALAALEMGQSSVEEGRQKIHAMENRLAQIETWRTSQGQKQDGVEKNLVVFQAEYEKLERQESEMQKICRRAGGELESLRQMKLNLASRTDQLTQELAAHRENLQREEEELSRLKEELTLRKSRLILLTELQRNFEGYEEGTRAVLLKKRETGAEGIFGTVADFVETEPAYEGAVSAVLGEKLQYVVVKTQSEGVEAAEYLRTAQSGRSTFVPVNLRNYGEASESLPEQEGVLGPLSRFVRLHAEYAGLKDFLFGDVYLVSNLRRALDIWAANGHRKTLVTLDGEVVDPTGVISGGTLANTSKALLEKKREMKELTRMIDALQTDLGEKERIRGEVASRVEGIEARLKEATHSSFEEEIKIANQEKDIAHFKKEIDSLKGRIKLEGERIIAEKKTREELIRELSLLQEEEEGLSGKVRLCREALNAGRETLELRQKTVEKESQILTRHKIDLAQARERQTHLQLELDRLQNEILGVRQERLKKEIEIREVGQNRENGIRTQAHLTRVIEKKLKKRDAVNESYIRQREAFDALAGGIREKEMGLKEMRLSHENMSRRLGEITVGLTEARGRMRLLVEQCLERHQQNLAEIYAQYLDENLDVAQAEEKVLELKGQLGRMGEVNTAALEEYEEIKTRLEFLTGQKNDLEASLETLTRLIQKVNRTTRERFLETFTRVSERFEILFPKLFAGGKAKLVLTDENNLLETGVEIVAQPPGKKLQSVGLLSGGEKALTAVSLIFSIFQIKPSPFCILDEVDAPLDDMNVERYNDLIREMTSKTQFIVITHNKKTMQMTDVLYGITMQEPGASQLVSVELS